MISWRQTTETMLQRMKARTIVHLARSFRPLIFHDKNRKILFLAIRKKEVHNTATDWRPRPFSDQVWLPSIHPQTPWTSPFLFQRCHKKIKSSESPDYRAEEQGHSVEEVSDPLGRLGHPLAEPWYRLGEPTHPLQARWWREPAGLQLVYRVMYQKQTARQLT